MAASKEFSPAATAALELFSLAGSDPLVNAVTEAVRIHMSQYDGSHDFMHIRRVVGVSRHLWEKECADKYTGPESVTSGVADPRVVVLAALLHDVGDRKYIKSAEYEPVSADEEKAIEALVEGTAHATNQGARATAAVFHRCAQAAGENEKGDVLTLGRKVIFVCHNVSWSGESKLPEGTMAKLVEEAPELAIVQDADRLDSLGAVGVARCFAYGAKAGVEGKAQGRSLEQSLDHFDEKLLIVETRMKTAEGRRLAKERTVQLQTFKDWFLAEAQFARGVGETEEA